MDVREGYIDRPDLERFSDNPLFNTKAVVQQTGVPAPTLRAWEHRYTILAPERADNDYRLYSERDIALIRWLKNRVDTGMAISQAIALLRHLEGEYQHVQRLYDGHESRPGSAPTFQVAFPPFSQSQSLPRLTQDEHESKPPTQPQPQPQPPLHSWSPVNVDQTLPSYPSVHSMYVVREKLLDAFRALDEDSAHKLMSSMLAVYTVEQVCAELITPTLWQVGQLWDKGQIGVSVEHFASGFFRGLLMNLLYITLSPTSGPLVLVCCAPGEAHELAPLMLALLLRRLGVRTAYLGQSIETHGLLEMVKQISPALICISVTMPAYLATLIDLGRRLQELPSPRPILTFGGQAFVQQMHLAAHVPGLYVSGDLPNVVVQLRRMVIERSENRN